MSPYWRRAGPEEAWTGARPPAVLPVLDRGSGLVLAGLAYGTATRDGGGVSAIERPRPSPVGRAYAAARLGAGTCSRPCSEGWPRPPPPDDARSGDLVAAAIGAQEAAGLEPLVDGGLWGSDELGTVVERWRATAALTDRAVKAVVRGPWSATGAPPGSVEEDALAHDLADGRRPRRIRFFANSPWRAARSSRSTNPP